MSKNVLYFEGAGANIYEEGSDIGNYRIRTAFLNNKGDKIYLELSGFKMNDKKRNLFGWKTFITHVFNISISSDENKSRIKCEKMQLNGYKKDSIIKWVNKNLDCNFKDMEVLNYFENYRVHGDDRKYNLYNLMDNHIKNDKRTIAREKAYNNIDNTYRMALNEEYSKISLLEIDEKSITIRCYAEDKKLNKTNLDRIKKIIVEY